VHSCGGQTYTCLVCTGFENIYTHCQTNIFLSVNPVMKRLDALLLIGRLIKVDALDFCRLCH